MTFMLFGRNWLTGIICLWSGTIASIPDGWALCDGSNGTPDMRQRFVRGAPDCCDAGGVGGDAEHNHNYDGETDGCCDQHCHYMTITTSGPPGGAHNYTSYASSFHRYLDHDHQVCGYTDYCNTVHSHGYADCTDVCAELPPYYELLFIMKE